MDKFNQEMAMKYGVKAAVVAQFLWDSKENPKFENMVRTHDKRQWIRCSQLMMTAVMPYLSRHMIRNSLRMLIKSKILMKGCFNQDKFDRTTWYSFTDFGTYMITRGGEIDD